MGGGDCAIAAQTRYRKEPQTHAYRCKWVGDIDLVEDDVVAKHDHPEYKYEEKRANNATNDVVDLEVPAGKSSRVTKMML